MNTYLTSLSRPAKRTIAIIADIFFIIFSVWLAYSIRTEKFHYPIGDEFLIYCISVFIAVPIFIKFGLYRAVLRYTGQHALWSIVRAIVLYGVLFSAVILLRDFWKVSIGVGQIPRSLAILQPLVLLVLIILSRSFIRLWLTDGLFQGRLSQNERRPTLIYGANSAGAQTGVLLQKHANYDLIGYVDDDFNLRHKTIHGVVIYGPDELARVVNRYGITHVILALPSIQYSERFKILERLRDFHLHVVSLPDMIDLAEGRVKVSDIRELGVEDLLNRKPVAVNEVFVEKNTAHSIVLVTGAGGSIGSELARLILTGKPKTLIILEQSEYALYTLDNELRKYIHARDLDVELVSLLGNVRDYDWLKKICSNWKIDIIYHAAAYKHVPIVENNIIEGILNNVWGTLNLARVAMAAGVNQFVLISTDKAVRPTNIMGASKRLAEMVLQALANLPEIKMRMCMVRFGNVLGSSGSVVPLFRSQINYGGPVTVTDPEVTRYFMTIPEAAGLVIQASIMAYNSGSTSQGAVYVLDMGEPVKIIDLAKKMIELSGFSIKDDNNPDGDIEIKITGLRPGEKLYEELLIGDDPSSTNHPRIMKAKEQFMPWNQLEPSLVKLESHLKNMDVQQIYSDLKNLVTGFSPISNVNNFFGKTK